MHFLLLLRPLNLFIVALTMYGIGLYFEEIYGVTEDFGVSSWPFTWLVISTVFIAAAGNIINDYFDVRADRINKPDRLIIGTHVKRRWAIVLHWGFNFVAFSIAVYLAWKLDTFAYLFIHVFTIQLLWFYSARLKRVFFLGNLLIAMLTAMVPVLVGLYFYQVYNLRHPEILAKTFYPFEQYGGSHYILWLCFGLAIFAFILNLAREIVKDMEDVEGDKKISARTLPIMLGYTQSKWITAGVLFGAVICSVGIGVLFNGISWRAMLPIFTSALLVLISYAFLPKASSIKEYKRINNLIKLAMVAGLISPIYWKVLLIYGYY